MWNQCGCSYAPIWFSKGLRITHAPHHTMSFVRMMFSSTNIYIYLAVNNSTLLYIHMLIRVAILIVHNWLSLLTTYTSSICHLRITVALLKSFGHQYCSHLLTIVDISSLHSFCQILLLLACRMCSILCLAQSHYT